MGSRYPSHRLGNGLFVSGRPDQPKEKAPTMSSTAMPYTGGDIKKSGELGKMFDIPTDGSKSRKSGPITGPPSRTASFGGAASFSGSVMSNAALRAGYTTSGPLSSGGLPGSASLKKSSSGPLNKHGEPVKKSSGPQSGGATRQNSGSIPSVLPATGLITSGPISSGPLNSFGAPKKVSGPLESTGSMKLHSSSISNNPAVTTLSQDDDYSVRRNFPKTVVWLVILIFVMGFLAGGFILGAVHNAILLIVVVVLFVIVAGLVVWNTCWGRRYIMEFTARYPDTDLRAAKNGQYVKVSGVVTCGNVPLESSFQRVPRCVYTNALGPRFPLLGNKLISLVLSKNKFRDGLPAEVTSYYQLQRLDLSNNKFVGPFPQSLLSLPSVTYLNVADNKFTGMLFENQSCSADLEFVDLSSNLMTGQLPNCLLQDSKRKVLYAANCLATGDENQHPISLCRNEALAVGILPQRKKRKASKETIAFGVIGGIVGGIALVGLIYLAVRKVKSRKTIKRPNTRLIAENASAGYPSNLLPDARYISQTMKLGALGLPPYRTFSLEEVEEATNNFDTSAFMGEGSQGQMYRGRLKDGSFVAIRCLKMKRSHSTQNFMHHIELISKLRHRHLVSALGHCFECYLDDSSVSRIFLVFEYVPNGTLRSWISGGHAWQKLQWTHRIAAAIGVAKGIQFLHTGIVPGVYSNNLKITDVLLDQNLIAKISSYNLPLLAENKGMVVHGTSSGASKDLSTSARINQDQKVDVYDFGLILLEIIVGRSLTSKNEVRVLKDQLQASITSDDTARSSIVDPVVRRSCSDQSLKTMMEICVSCLLKNPADRPSVEDILWNLQYAAQVQDPWRGDSQSSEGSPVSPAIRPRLHITIH